MEAISKITTEIPFKFVISSLVVVILTVALFLRVKKSLTERRQRWWKQGVIYHIYPRSFQDSTGDGNGDLRGVLSRLDYFDYIGVNILYFSPIFKSPMVDNGYDVSDFKEINPMFGSMEDFEILLQAVHTRGMKLLLDFVPNHTSDQHPWFLESRRSKNKPKRDWYIWKDPAKDGGPPNNWVSIFGGSAWSFDKKTNQYYLHQFYKEQPDLNFRNHEVQEAMKGVLGFWLDKGVDGFRIDAVPHLLEDEGFKDEPTLLDYDPEDKQYKDLEHKYTYNLDGVHDIVKDWRKLCDKYKDPYRVLIGEIMSGTDVIMAYYGQSQPEFDFPFNFTFLGLEECCTAYDVNKQVTDYLSALPQGKWPNWLLGNHDVKRAGTRVGETCIPAVTVLYLALPGTAIMYYGDELGLLDADIPAKDIKDLRDPCRSPMQWSGGKNAGFTKGKKLWLPLTGNNHKEKNVELQKADPTSVLNLTKKVLDLRNAEAAFHGLDFRVVHVDAEVFGYLRSHRRSKYLVVVNFGSGIWCGALQHLSGTGVIVIDSSTIKEGSVVNFSRMLIHPGQAIIAKVY